MLEVRKQLRCIFLVLLVIMTANCGCADEVIDNNIASVAQQTSWEKIDQIQVEHELMYADVLELLRGSMSELLESDFDYCFARVAKLHILSNASTLPDVLLDEKIVDILDSYTSSESHRYILILSIKYPEFADYLRSILPEEYVLNSYNRALTHCFNLILYPERESTAESTLSRDGLKMYIGNRPRPQFALDLPIIAKLSCQTDDEGAEYFLEIERALSSSVATGELILEAQFLMNSERLRKGD